MRSLCTEDILRIWEVGQHQGPVERALSSLAPAFPEAAIEDLSELRLGLRNRLLLAVRENLFGRAVRAYAECSACGQRLEFTLDGGRLLADERQGESEEVSVVCGEFRLRLRPVTSADLSAVQQCSNAESARALVLQRCLLEAVNEGASGERPSAGLGYADLPPDVVIEMEDKLAEADPNAELVVRLECPACGNECQMPLDLGSFLWTEISIAAKRLIREVGQLARAFGWREQDILGMTAARRQAYLEMVGRG